MNDQPDDPQPADVSRTPFDDYSGGQPAKRRLHLAPIKALLRILSAIALLFAFATACAIILLDALHYLRPDLGWRIKSALPLIGIGASYALLSFTLPRTRTEFLLGLAVSLAFILWGAEQFIPIPRIASQIDDGVVFLFVMDLAVVIRGHLKRTQK
ncbi:MAG: hypothetical protein ABSE62_16345 [Chthoniobacteraceae bacterium]|jgi:hypothetical protein